MSSERPDHFNGCPAARLCVRATACLALLILCRGAAADRVTVQPAEAGSPITIVGDIEEFNGRRISIRTRSGAPLHTYPTDEVLSVTTYYSPQHQQAIAKFEANDHKEARRLFDVALAREPRPWVKRELRAWLVRCALMDSDRTTAGTQFVEIVRSDEETRHWGVAPLIWAPEPVNEELRAAARNWIAARNDAVRLLGASVLLLDPSFGEVARTEMDNLTRSSNRSVVELARSQRWRMRLTEAELSPRELAGWSDRIGRLPESLRGGPHYLVGRAYLSQGNLEQAAAEFLWVPLVYNDDRLLSARASLDAAHAMARLGRVDEAISLYGELVEEYDWSPFAGEARTRLESFAGSGG